MGPGAWRGFPEHFFFPGYMLNIYKKLHFWWKKRPCGERRQRTTRAGGSQPSFFAGGRVFAGKKRPCEASHLPDNRGWGPPGRRPPGGQNPGFSKNAPGASGGLRGLPLSPPVPLVGPLGPQRAQKSPGGLMGPLGPHGARVGPLGPHVGPRCAAGLARSALSALYSC